jgi:hypothetical protein
MTVQGNVGPEVDVVVQRDLVNLRTFHMEYDTCSVSCYIFQVHVNLFGLRVSPLNVIIHCHQMLL